MSVRVETLGLDQTDYPLITPAPGRAIHLESACIANPDSAIVKAEVKLSGTYLSMPIGSTGTSRYCKSGAVDEALLVTGSSGTTFDIHYEEF